MPDDEAENGGKPLAPKMERTGFHLGIRFHPEIRLLDRKRGREFAQKLAPIIDPEKMDLESPDAWRYVQRVGSSPNSFLAVTVTPESVQLDAPAPTHGKEWYEDRYRGLLKEFRNFFSPSLMLGSTVIVRGVLPIHVDAREFLSSQVMRIHPDRNTSFGRPIHLVGLRLFFPPFKKTGSKKKSDTVKWSVDVKAESLMDDPSKLFLEAQADWPTPTQWTEAAEQEEVNRLETVSEFLEKNVINFLLENPDGQAADGPQEIQGE